MMLNFDWLSGLSMAQAKGVIIGIFFVIGALVMLLRRAYIFEGVEEPHWWMNLKLWAIGVLSVIVATYLYL